MKVTKKKKKKTKKESIYSQGFAIPKNLDSNVKSKLALLTKQYMISYQKTKKKKWFPN